MKYLRFTIDVLKCTGNLMRINLGKSLREAGLKLDQKGSII